MAQHLGAVAQVMADPVARAALEALGADRYRIEDAVMAVPDEPGLYAVYSSPEIWEELRLEPPGDHPLYVGKAERSLATRDIRTHFASGHTGSSTLRRSFAALLRDSLGLRGVPRNPSSPERPANYGLSPENDALLTEWMHENLGLAVWVKPLGVDLDGVETTVLAELQPPLNLAKVARPSRVLRDARKLMADDVRTWARERGLDL